MSMPSAEGMRHFDRGVSRLKGQWTGRESPEVAKQLLPIAVGQRSVKLNPDLTGLTRSILNFAYRAHASWMTNKEADWLEQSLADFHQFKNVLIREGLFKNDKRFDQISKLHALTHWTHCIRKMGTPDNFSTEGPEHLHITCAKQGWQALNKIRPTKQMVTFIQRYEALRIHCAYMDKWLGVNGQKGHRKRSRVVYGEEVEGPQRLSRAGGNGGGTAEEEANAEAEA
ncbi:hypothetical protein FRC07_014605, partial [Ceratobasidium sp. 392]